MKSISISGSALSPETADEVARTLAEGELVCIPTRSGYRLVAALDSAAAVTAMLQAKRRVQNAPALVLLPATEWLDRVAAELNPDARKLIDRFWPGPVTLLVRPSEEMDPRIRKSLTRATGWLGVRLADDEVSQSLLSVFCRPVAVSSANLSRKGGAGSLAQVKKNFGRTVQLLVERGDIPLAGPSTLVDVTEAPPRVIREGAVSSSEIHAALASA